MTSASNVIQLDQDEYPPADVQYEGAGAQFSREALQLQVPLATIKAQRTPGDAFRLAIIASGLDPKEVFMELGLDAGYFTNIGANRATLKAEKIAPFCAIVKNLVYPQWIAMQLGGVIVDQKEHEALLAKAKLCDELAKENALLRQVFTAQV